MASLRKQALWTLLFSAVYFVSYLTRHNFAAVAVEMTSSTGWSRATLSLCMTGGFITYGAGQLVSGYFGDKISPKRLVLYGLLTTAAMNALLPFCRYVWLMVVLWSVNGLAQAFLWPPLLRLASQLFSPEEYRKAVLTISCCGTAGTIALYLTAPLVLSRFGWRGVFLIASGFGFIMAALWYRFCPLAPSENSRPHPEASQAVSSAANNGMKPMIRFLFLILASNILLGALRDGVTTWTPSYIGESFGLQNQTAILVSVLLPILGFVGYGISGLLNRRSVRDPVLCAALFFGLGTISSAALFFCMGRSAIGNVLLLGLLVAAMYGANLMLTGMLPAYFAGTGRISLISGLLNASVYVGSALSTYGIAALSERTGWTVTIGCWTVMAGISVVLCLGALFLWKNRGLRNRLYGGDPANEASHDRTQPDSRPGNVKTKEKTQ